MNIFSKIFKSKKKKEYQTILSKVLGADETKKERLNDPNVVWIATVIYSGYAAVLEKTSKMIFGVPESLLPYPREDIKEAIDLLLTYLNDDSSWDELRREFPEAANSILNKEFHSVLKVSYIQLAKFISDDKDAQTAVKGGTYLMQKSELTQKDIDEFKAISPSLVKIQKKISKNSSALFEELIKKTHMKNE